MEPKTPKAIASGTVRIGDAGIPCAVLDDADNTRVLTQDGFLEAIGRSKRPKGGQGGVLDGLPAFLRANNLKPFISKNIRCSTEPIIFEPQKGGGISGKALGYKADLLPGVCWVYHDAERADALAESQKHIAEYCNILLRALTNVAIDALVDEATGFQDVRARDALQKILDKYISREARPWVKTFDDDFYREIFRLNSWPYSANSFNKRPGIIGQWTNDIYDRLAPGVKDELHRIAKRDESGKLAERLHQHLNESGHPKLVEHLTGIKALMRACKTWPQFQSLLKRAYPKFKDNYELDLGDA